MCILGRWGERDREVCILGWWGEERDREVCILGWKRGEIERVYIGWMERER